MDQYLLRAERLMVGEGHEAALEITDSTIAFQKEHNLTLPEEFHFKYAQVAFSAGLVPGAIAAVNQCFSAAGIGRQVLQRSARVVG